MKNDKIHGAQYTRDSRGKPRTPHIGFGQIYKNQFWLVFSLKCMLINNVNVCYTISATLCLRHMIVYYVYTVFRKKH